MVEVRERGSVAPADMAIVDALAAAATAADGHPPFGDAVWRDLADPGDWSRLLIAYDGETPIAALELELWTFGADATSDSFAAAAGFTVARELWQMRVALPLEEQPRWPSPSVPSTFEVGKDEPRWVAVNNRAFAADPDQSAWTVDTLLQREAEPWFDPSGFLLISDGTGLGGFCWTKLHAPEPPAEPACLGEIYVIGVDPDRHGKGLGRALVVAGLASLYERGATVGMLFVDSNNASAVALYRKLGFETTRVDRAYSLVVS